jgi:hypothetical protein
LSRPKSGREAKAKPAKPAKPAKAAAPIRRGAAAARPSAAAARGVFVQKPKSDVYVVLLGVALGAIFLGCLFLGLVMARYDFKRTVSSLEDRLMNPVAIEAPATTSWA